MVDLSEVSSGDEVGELGDGRVAAVGEADGGDDVGLLLGRGHGASGLQGLGDLAVQGVADDDRDDIDLGILGDLAPVVDGLLIAVALRGVLG